MSSPQLYRPTSALEFVIALLAGALLVGTVVAFAIQEVDGDCEVAR